MALPEFEEVVAHRVAVDAVHRQHEHHQEVGEKERRIEGVPVVQAPEGLVGVLHLQVVLEALLWREGPKGQGMQRRWGENQA